MAADAYDSGAALERGLGVELTQEVRRRLEMGENAKSVAAMIKKDWKCFEDKAPSTVLTMVHRYRRSITSQTLIKRIQRSMGTNRHVKALDTMVELTHLIKMQRTRIETVMKVEEKTKMLMAQTGIEMRLLKDLCRDLAHLQLETGVLVRAPKTINGMLGTPDGKVVQFSWTENDERLLDNLDKDSPTIEGSASETEDEGE